MDGISLALQEGFLEAVRVEHVLVRAAAHLRISFSLSDESMTSQVRAREGLGCSRIVMSMKKSEALKILGLADGASDDEVKKAHRKLVVANHPDKFPIGTEEHDKAEELTKQINEARDVLINRSWSPEFDPRRDPRPYAGNPYAHPSGSSQTRSGSGYSYNYGGSSGSSGTGGSAYDPFAGWPFGAGQTTYVWTSWDDIFSGSSAGAGSSAGQSAQNSQTTQSGTWPFGGFTVEYDPLDPFAAFRTNYAQKQSPEKVFEKAKHELTLEGGMVAAKAAALGAFAAFGNVPTGLFIYVMTSIIYGLYKKLGSFFVFLLIPIAIVGTPLVFLLIPRSGYASMPLVICFFIALLFDFTNLRDRIRVFMAAKKQKDAESSTK